MDAIGGYQLLGRVSENRPISVWKGRDSARARDVAVTRVELTTDEAIARVRLQARVLAGISHPGIVEVLELIEDQQHAWLVEGWVDGVRLSRVLAAGELTAPQVLGVASCALLGLQHAHGHGIVHGNVVPINLLIDRSGSALLANFGAVDPAAPMTPQSDLAAVAALLEQALSETSPAVAAVIHPAEPYRDAGQFRDALNDAAAATYGARWRDQADLSGRVATLSATAPVPLGPVPNGVVLNGSGAAAPSEPKTTVQVRSAARSTPPAAVVDSDADVREFLESRSPGRSGEAMAGRFIPIAAAAVVVIAIVILVLTHHDRDPGVSPGLAFKGTYAVASTLTTAGVGPDADRVAGSVRNTSWLVTSACDESRCTAVVTPAGSTPFTLTLANGTWTGDRAMPAASCVGSGGTSVGLDSFVLTASTSDKAGVKFSGSVAGIFGGCGQSTGENSQLTVMRTKS